MRRSETSHGGSPNPPAWGVELLRCPQTGARLELRGDRLLRADGAEIGRIDAGIVRMPVHDADASIAYYRSIGGAHFHERAEVAFAMSSLDTPVYHQYLREFDDDPNHLIVDIGGGDGRNSRPWLERGYQRVVLVDAVAEALVRFRDRVANEHPEWLERLTLVEGDARRLPLATACADRVLAIESLLYLNEDYGQGMDECRRLLVPGGRLLLSERDYEGALIMQLLYRGTAGMLESAATHATMDGLGDGLVRSRCFTERELVELLQARDFEIVELKGTSLVPILLGWMRGKALLDDGDASRLEAVRALLQDLGKHGRARRCHVIVASLPP